jgi:hypothetical protein
MPNRQTLNVEEASRLAVTAIVTDLEDWANRFAVDGHIELDDLVDVLALLRATCLPEQVPALTALAAS